MKKSIYECDGLKILLLCSTNVEGSHLCLPCRKGGHILGSATKTDDENLLFLSPSSIKGRNFTQSSEMRRDPLADSYELRRFTQTCQFESYQVENETSTSDLELQYGVQVKTVNPNFRSPPPRPRALPDTHWSVDHLKTRRPRAASQSNFICCDSAQSRSRCDSFSLCAFAERTSLHRRVLTKARPPAKAY